MILRFQGRFGNKLFQYCHARAVAERRNEPLLTEPWEGELIFGISHDRPPADAKSDVTSFCQRQADLVYTRTQARDWLRFRPEVLAVLRSSVLLNPLVECRAHLRRGDYDTAVYVIVSRSSYLEAAADFRLPEVYFVQEEFPCLIPGLPPFLPDFYRLMMAPMLLRANSTFSWWAHVLGIESQKVFSPFIEGKPPGKQHCQFAEGNWPRFANLPETTDLHLPV